MKMPKDEKQTGPKRRHKKYRKLCNRKKYAWRKAVKKYYRKFVTETADMKGAAKLMRSVKRDGFVPPTLLSNNGQYTSSKEDTVKLLMDTHFPGSLEAQLELEQYYNEMIEGDKPKVKLQKIPWIDPE